MTYKKLAMLEFAFCILFTFLGILNTYIAYTSSLEGKIGWPIFYILFVGFCGYVALGDYKAGRNFLRLAKEEEK